MLTSSANVNAGWVKQVIQPAPPDVANRAKLNDKHIQHVRTIAMNLFENYAMYELAPKGCLMLARSLAGVVLACLTPFAAAASCLGSTYPFSICDDFNGTTLDTAVWKHISASRGDSTQGQTASVHDGYLDLTMNQTDNGGAVVARFAPQRYLKVTLTHNMHPGNTYFMPAVLLESSAGTYVTYMNWLRSSYAPDYCSKAGAYDKVRLVVDTTASWCNTAVFSTNSASGYFDRWTTAAMAYDMDSGLVTVDLDNDGTPDIQATVPVAQRKAITGVSLQPFGWYTGHWHRIDAVRIEGTPVSTVTSSGSQCGSTVTSTLFADDFAGSSVDGSKWLLDTTGGTVGVASGKVTFSGGSNRFPYARTVQNPFPATGDFSLYCKARLVSANTYGTGPCFAGEKTISAGGAAWTYDSGTSFGIWQNFVYVQANDGVSNKTVIANQTIANPTQAHEFEFCVQNNAVKVFQDGSLIASGTMPTGWHRPTAVMMGNPVVAATPWSSFETDKVEVRALASAQVVVPMVPTLTASPAGTVLPVGSTLALGLTAPQAGVTFELCLGASATAFDLACVPISPTGMTVPVAAGWDFYVAARAVSGSTKSGFSNPVRIQSAADSGTSGGAWIPGRLGSDFDHIRKSGNAAPTLQLVVSATGPVRPGQVVVIEAQTADPDSSNLFFHWFATAGDFRPKVANFKSVEWRAPAAGGRYIIKGSVGDGDGNTKRAYVLITVQ